MTIKKVFKDVVALLEANPNKKVSTILDEVLALCESKTQGSASIKDADGKVIAIFCYYHKQWELIADVPYGKKASSATGLNTMCKVGTSLWTKQQREAKKAEVQLLTDVAKGTVAPEDIVGIQEDIESARKEMLTTDMPVGYASEEELMQALQE